MRNPITPSRTCLQRICLLFTVLFSLSSWATHGDQIEPSSSAEVRKIVEEILQHPDPTENIQEKDLGSVTQELGRLLEKGVHISYINEFKVVTIGSKKYYFSQIREASLEAAQEACQDIASHTKVVEINEGGEEVEVNGENLELVDLEGAQEIARLVTTLKREQEWGANEEHQIHSALWPEAWRSDGLSMWIHPKSTKNVLQTPHERVEEANAAIRENRTAPPSGVFKRLRRRQIMNWRNNPWNRMELVDSPRELNPEQMQNLLFSYKMPTQTSGDTPFRDFDIVDFSSVGENSVKTFTPQGLQNKKKSEVLDAELFEEGAYPICVSKS